MRKVSIVGLPHQTVQFQWCARNMRDAVASDYWDGKAHVSIERRMEILAKYAQNLHEMVERNYEFWMAQLVAEQKERDSRGE